MTLSFDGQILATGSNTGSVRLWNLYQPDAAPTVLDTQEMQVSGLHFSPNGNTLSAADQANTLRVWELRRSNPTYTVLQGHTDAVSSIAFSPDSQTLATSSHDQTIRLWQVHTVRLADMVCERVWRNLTLDEWRQFVGADIPYERTCLNLPIHPSALETGQEQTKPGHGGG